MTQLRQAKVDGITVPDMEVDDPSGSARILVLGWGSTYGPIAAAARAARANGLPVATAHLRHLNPMPANTGAVLRSYDPVSYTHLRAHETVLDLVCRLLLDTKTPFNIDLLFLYNSIPTLAYSLSLLFIVPYT